MSEQLKKHYVLITRMFDNQVKAFMKNILSKHRVAYYCYRIEFQARGMPHVHGVFWLCHEDIKDFTDNDGNLDKDKLPSLIDEWISCSTNTEDEVLNELVKDLNVHRHTKSCRKYGTICRFHFPKLPSDETLIASPLPDELDEDEKQQKLESAKELLDKVKEFLPM